MAFYGMYIGNNRVMFQPQIGGKLLGYADDLSITPALLYDGYLESGLTNFMLRYLEPGMKVVDVGANIGYFSVLAGYRVGNEGRVYSFEANPHIYEILVDNLTINELKHNVVHSNKAVYSSTATLNFNVSKKFQGNSSLKRHSDQYKEDFKSDSFEEISVQCISLDDLPNIKRIDLIKIDVEGAELGVFQGMKNLVSNNMVKIVVFELNKSMLGGDANTLKSLLESYDNARFSLLDPNGNLIPTTIEEIFQKDYIDNIVLQF